MRTKPLPYCHSCHTSVEDWDLHNQLLHVDADPEEPLVYGGHP